MVFLTFDMCFVLIQSLSIYDVISWWILGEIKYSAFSVPLVCLDGLNFAWRDQTHSVHVGFFDFGSTSLFGRVIIVGLLIPSPVNIACTEYNIREV